MSHHSTTIKGTKTAPSSTPQGTANDTPQGTANDVFSSVIDPKAKAAMQAVYNALALNAAASAKVTAKANGQPRISHLALGRSFAAKGCKATDPEVVAAFTSSFASRGVVIDPENPKASEVAAWIAKRTLIYMSLGYDSIRKAKASETKAS